MEFIDKLQIQSNKDLLRKLDDELTYKLYNTSNQVYYDLYTELYTDEPIQELNIELNNKICDL